MKKIKGFSLISLVLIIAAVAVVGVVIYFIGKGGFGFGGGKGDGEGDGNVEPAQQAMATVQVSETVTEITTKEIEYVEVTVHENTYLYNNKVYELSEIESLMNDIKKSEGRFTVRITDDNASSKAYSQLLSAFEDKMITYIEISE